MTVHISVDGMVEDEKGFLIVKCDCGETIGPETMLDMAMEHAWSGGVDDAHSAVHSVN